MKNYAVLERMKQQMKDIVEIAFNKGYDQGYKDGHRKGVERGREIRVAEADFAYQYGLRKAWDAARKVMLSPEEGAIDSGTVKEIFGINYYAVLKNLPVDEVISKIDAWEKKQERHCYNCGQPRDYKDCCIPYREGKCEKSHEAWIPKQERQRQPDKVDCNNTDCKECIKHNYCDYEDEKQDAIESNVGSIKIGDEIKVVKDSRIIGAKGVVVNINNATLGAISSRGYFATWIKNVINTGYHYDIQSIFDDIKSHEREI